MQNGSRLKDILRRSGWFMLAMLFVLTGVGVGIYAFWQGTHQQPNSTPQSANSCTFNPAVSGPVLTAPATYQPNPVPTALQATDLQKGTGKMAEPGSCVTAKYYGSLASSGLVFDQDYTNPTALQFVLGEGAVIPGWDQGLIGMKVGGERRLVIPPSLGYGSQAQGPIPANSTLVFVVKLLTVK